MEAASTFKQSHVVPSLHIQTANNEGEVTESSFPLIHAQKMLKGMQNALQKEGTVQWMGQIQATNFFVLFYISVSSYTLSAFSYKSMQDI